MGTGYTRNDTPNNIADGNVINASDLDGEFDAIQAAFDGTSGHSHDGTTGEGPQIGAAGIANDAVALGTKTTGNYVAAGAVSGVGRSGSASAEGATFTVTSNATDANTASTIVARDASGNFSAGTITATLSGNATTATTATTANSVAADSVALGTDTTGNYVAAGAVSGVGLSGSASAEGATFTVTSNATDANTASTIVARDASGDFSAGTITASLTGTASNAALLDSLDSTQFLRSDAADVKTSGDLTFSDNVKAVFGTGSDLQIYHDGSNSYIADVGTGNFLLKTNGLALQILDSGDTELANFNNNGSVYLKHVNAGVDTNRLQTTSSGVTVTGTVTMDGGSTSGDFSFGDNDKAVFGAGSDLQIYHTGSDSRIVDAGTGNLTVQATNFVVNNSADSQNMIVANDGGAVSLYHNGGTRFTTTSGGIDVTGTITFDGGTTSADLNFGDSDKAIFGAGNDLQIYHDGTNSRIDDAGTGNLVIRGSSAITLGKYTGETMLEGIADGAVSLYHNNIKKFETTSVGVTVSGDIIGPASADFDIKTGSGTGEMLFHTNSLERVRIGLDGKVGIGQSATTDLLEVNGDVRAVDFNATSDERLKSNIRQIENALDKVCQMNGMHYVLDGKESSGVIAQNIQTVAPEAVSDSGEHLTVAYNQLIGYLVEAVKELKTEVEELKNGNTPSVS